MPVCRQHGNWPCLPCKIQAYKQCIEENKTRTEKHDLTDLKKSIIELGGESQIA